MKMLTLFLLLFSSLAYAGEETALSKKISQSAIEELKEVPAGKYKISLMATYRYQLGPNGPNTGRPVFLSALKTYELPKDLQDCDSNANSLVCAAAAEFVNWYQNSQPARQGSLDIKFIMFENCDGYFCPFYKDTQISVEINN